MSSKTKWIIAAVLVLGIVVVAQASVLNDIYMPVIYVGPTITPIPTATPKPSDCLVQYFYGQKLKICFTDINQKPTSSPLDEWVDIKHIGGGTVDMTGWFINSDSSTGKYDFPDSFEIKVGQTVKIYTRSGNNGTSQLYMNRTVEFWKDNKDCGYLKDEDRNTINAFCYGVSGFSAAADQ